MTDYFVLLGESRRPWLDPESLKSKFLMLAAEKHPDRAPTTDKQAAQLRYADLNVAYLCLREPKERLRHLLELERGEKMQDVQSIPPMTMDSFLEVSVACREADSLLVEKERTTSPLLKIPLFEKGVELVDRLKELLQKLDVSRETLIEKIKELNPAWEAAPAAGSPMRMKVLPFGRLEDIYREFSYLTRWSQQIQERLVQLSL